MSLRKLAFSSALAATLISSVPARRAEAGPLLDWLFHRQAAAPAVPVGPPYAVGSAPLNGAYPGTYPGTYASGYAPLPYTAGYLPYSTGYAPYNTSTYNASAYNRTLTPYTSGYTPYGVAYPTVPTSPMATAPVTVSPPTYAQPTYGTYYGANSPIVGANGYGYLAQRPTAGSIVAPQAVMPSTLPPTVPATMQQGVPSSVPVTLVPDYRTTTSRTPVTYYRPILTTDPATGAQVVTLAPCSSYEYQTQRVPTWGLTQVYNGGASLPAVAGVAPATTPTYSLPRGGVPLSGPMPSTQPYTSAYGALMPSVPATAPTSMVMPLPATTGSIITPAAPYSSGYGSYASNYGNYSTLQPPVAVPQSSVYPTSPIGGNTLGPYYNSGNSSAVGSGSTGGGSTGTYAAPGGAYGAGPNSTGPYATGPYATNPYASQPATAPIGSATLPPITSSIPGAGSAPVFPPPSSSYPSPSMPGATMPGATMPSPSMPGAPMPGAVYPPSNDPAAGSMPSLPPLPSGARLDSKPQLQNVVQQPMPGMRSFNASPSSPPTTSANRSQLNERSTSKEVSPGLLPIPVPDDFKHEPRWNPGLLKEQDTTAAATTGLRPNTRSVDPQVAWGSKTIHWASFTESSNSKADLDQALELSAALPSPQPQLRDKPVRRQARPEVPATEQRLQEEMGLKLVPGNAAAELRMVPLPTEQPTVAGPQLSDRLELSASDAATTSPRSLPTSPLQNQAATQSANPATTPPNSRYPTGGWKAR